eukprot:CAMPEP_0182568588 /NCGR_PEP_ID=MMETSP1324-20130603/9483_1 /TAXON_ID=236786 /ORGANISM="Florenciella sp., Strain RCC1587" /LENGTH=50 /DNA_ID=CAMNT_0024782751 /DNA_START=41 /DNA_END=193 /DNA_ORIENTATION=+
MVTAPTPATTSVMPITTKGESPCCEAIVFAGGSCLSFRAVGCLNPAGGLA